MPSVEGWILGFAMASAREISQRDRGSEGLTVVEAPVVGLRPHERNPRSITKQRLAALKADLEADPDMLRARPLIVLPDGRVIAGNQRLRAVQELGWETVPVVYADLIGSAPTMPSVRRWLWPDE